MYNVYLYIYKSLIHIIYIALHILLIEISSINEPLNTQTVQVVTPNKKPALRQENSVDRQVTSLMLGKLEKKREKHMGPLLKWPKIHGYLDVPLEVRIKG